MSVTDLEKAELCDVCYGISEDIGSIAGRLCTDHDTLRAEVERLKPDAHSYRKLNELRKAHPGIPCACEFDDDGDEILRWCDFHKEVRERAEKAEGEVERLRQAFAAFLRDMRTHCLEGRGYRMNDLIDCFDQASAALEPKP